MGLFDFMTSGTSLPKKGIPAPDQKRELLLYKYNACPFCRRVAHAVDRLDLDVPTADIQQDSSNRKALAAATGRTTVPCLFIDGVPLFESLDIVAWLQTYKDNGFG